MDPAATNAIAIGPVSLEGPSVGLVKMAFKEGILVLTVGIGVDVAKLNFGGGGTNQSSPSTTQSNSGVRAELNGVLGKFDIEVDVLAAISGEDGAFSVPGKFGLEITSLMVEVPDVVIVTATGIRVDYDPNYDPELNNSLPQQLMVVQTAIITFPKIGISGTISPFEGKPGLVITTDGFTLGEAQLIYDPDGGALPANPNAQQPAATTATNTQQPGAKIRIGSVLELDDIRVGVQNFEVDFETGVEFDGNIFIASGGAIFFPGKPVTAIISDRLTSESTDNLLGPGIPDTEAIRATLEFEDGRVKAFLFDVDTFKVQFGSLLTLTGRDFMLDTGAEATEELVSFARIGAEVKIGSTLISGEARNFAFLGDGTFITKPGFGVFLGVGSATGDTFKWPKWLPIRITEIGIEWPDIQADASDFLLTLSAAVTGIQGMKGVEFSGAIEGVKIDVRKLLAGEFPIVDIAAIGVTVTGKAFGGELNAGLIGGILKIDAAGRMIDTFDRITPVEERIFFVGIQGGFEIAGSIGVNIRFAISELGPLGLFLNVSVPGGVLLEPNTGLSMNDFTAGVEFFKTLPSLDDPLQLRDPSLAATTTIDAAAWLDSVKRQVVTQNLLIKANPGMNGFSAAFTSPMTITGSAKIFSIYTSQQLFNGEVIIKISTDGKILIIGKLNFAADNLSISGRLYADLSRVASGDVTVLFLADIPDQVELLTLYGKLKMGFRNPDGEEIAFDVLLPEAAETPTAVLAGPRDDDSVGAATLNDRGYIDVTFAAPSGSTVDLASITDLSAEINVPESAGFVIDETQEPVDVGNNTFLFWTIGAGSETIEIAAESWSSTDGAGQTTFNADAESVAVTVIEQTYLDVKFLPQLGADLDEALIVSAGASMLRVERRRATDNTLVTDDIVPIEGPTPLGDGQTFRYFFDMDFAPDSYTVVIEADAWQDSAGNFSSATNETFQVITPIASVAGPFTGGSIDVAILNGEVAEVGTSADKKYIDIVFDPTPGTDLDYESILDPEAEFDWSVAGQPGPSVDGRPIPIEFAENDDFVLVASEVTNDQDLNDDDEVDDDDLYIHLTTEGVTRFRYLIDDVAFTYQPSEIQIDFTVSGWFDSAGNPGVDGPAFDPAIRVEGPTADLVDPSNGANVDVNEINNRNFLDVTFEAAPADFEIDFQSITDLEPEFALVGDGLGDVRLDSSQAPIVLDPAAREVRYWLRGNFLAGAEVSLEFLPESWSFKTLSDGTPQALTLSEPTGIEVTFPDPDAGFEIDPASITEPPRVYRRAFGSNIRLLFHVRSRFHRTSPLLRAA